MLCSQCNSEQTFENPYLLQGQIPLKILHPRNPPNAETQFLGTNSMTEALLLPLFMGPRVWDAWKFRCLSSVCKHAENAAKHRKNTNFLKIGGSTQFCLRAWKRSANSENFCRLETLAPETEGKCGPRDKNSKLRVARSSRRVPNQISIRICTARYREIWVSRSGGFRGCCIFSGKHHIWDPQPMSLTLWIIFTIDAQRLNTATLSGLLPTSLIFEWVMSHILMSRAAHVNESCRSRSTTEFGNIEWLTTATCQRWMSHVAPINDSCRTHERVMSQVLNDLIGQDGVAYYCHTKNRMPMSGRNSQNSQNTQLRLNFVLQDYIDLTLEILHMTCYTKNRILMSGRVSQNTQFPI